MLVDEEPEKINVAMRTFKDEKIRDSLEAYSKHIQYPVEPKGSKTDPKVILCVYVVV
jgi:HSP90 family molecular chaperone